MKSRLIGVHENLVVWVEVNYVIYAFSIINEV
jgi:hypothetical protein